MSRLQSVLGGTVGGRFCSEEIFELVHGPEADLEEVAAMAVATPDARPIEHRDHRSRRSPSTRRRTSLSERLTLNVIVGLAAALLAFVLAASLMSDRRQMVTVAVATDRIAVGTVITLDMLTSSQVPANIGFANALVSFDRFETGSLVATRTVQAGEPLTDSAVGDPGTVSGNRVMSIPLEKSQAANGEIAVGDQVDVIVTDRDAGSRYVLTSAAVVGRSGGPDSGGLAGGVRNSDLVITVEVDAAQALELATAIDSGTITVVRSTGAAPIVADPIPGSEAGG